MGLEGDCSLKVLSVIDPLLFCRSKAGAPALPFDDVDQRRCILFVCISPTGIGDVV